MNDDLISSVKRDKKNWFGLDRTTKFKSVEPNNRYFTGLVHQVVDSFVTSTKDYLLEKDPALLYSMKNKPLPQKYQKKIAADNTAPTSEIISEKKEEIIKEVVEEAVQVLNPLDQYQEDMKKKRQEQLDKRSQINIGNQLRFSATVKKDPDRGMGWVSASGSINQGKLGHSQSWKFKIPKKFEYY
jgi:hypothetical protein